MVLQICRPKIKFEGTTESEVLYQPVYNFNSVFGLGLGLGLYFRARVGLEPDLAGPFTTCTGNLLSLGAKMCIWNLTEGRSRNCDFKCKLDIYFCGFGLYSCNAILHAMCFQFCLLRNIHKKCIPILI